MATARNIAANGNMATLRINRDNVQLKFLVNSALIYIYFLYAVTVGISFQQIN